jgi:CheY-like chemotaxis protein
MAPGTVLVVDDDDGSCELLCRLLARDGHVVERVSNAELALSVVEAVRPSCVVLALSFGGISRNFQLLDAIRAQPDAPIASTRVVLITYRTDDQTPVSWRQTGADAVLSRPFHADELTRAVAGVGTGAS